jgi:quinolinate synthase
MEARAPGVATARVVNNEKLISRILELKRQKNAIILAHYYQPPEIQDIADYIGDSLGLSREAAQTDADIIVFAGVYFMAETAKIINPEKKVLLPDIESGCSLADSCPADKLQEMKDRHPDHVVVSYINCSAAVKAISDIVCTSANAEKIVNSIPASSPIMFVPDKHLGEYLIRKTGRNMLLWDGACVVHEAFSIEKLVRLHLENPDALIIAHPESDSVILKAASYIGSTTGMINFVKNDPHHSFIVATEAGILHQMQKAVPDKKLIAAPAYENNSCACSECGYMKLSSLAKLLACLESEKPEIKVPADVASKAMIPIRKMFEISTV